MIFPNPYFKVEGPLGTIVAALKPETQRMRKRARTSASESSADTYPYLLGEWMLTDAEKEKLGGAQWQLRMRVEARVERRKHIFHRRNETVTQNFEVRNNACDIFRRLVSLGAWSRLVRVGVSRGSVECSIG